MFDALICGAGPAGAIAALVLARRGARVLVLDRARFPRPKLCGDTLNPGAIAILQRLGVADVLAGALRIDGMIVTGEPRVRVSGHYGDDLSGRAIARTDLDSRLLAAAEQAGARVEQGALVREPLRDGATVRGVAIAGRDGRPLRITAPMTIAADGAGSRLARALGLARHAPAPRRWAVGAYFEGVSGLTTYGEMHVRRGRYIGVAPLPSGLANACVVTADRAALAHPSALLESALRSDPLLADRFARARRVTRVTCLGPLAVEAVACGVPGLLLAGDAAGFIDPMTGDGLRFAFRGAELAAECAAARLEDETCPAHERLRAARAAEFGSKWRFNRTLRALVASPAAVRAVGRGAAIAPAIIRTVIRYAGDLDAA